MIQREGAKATFASARVQRNRVLYNLFQMVLMYGGKDFPENPYKQFMELARLMINGEKIDNIHRQQLRELIPFTATTWLMPVFEYFAGNDEILMREAKWDREFLKDMQGRIDLHIAEEEYYFRFAKKSIPKFEKMITLNTSTLERLRTGDAPFVEKVDFTITFGNEYSGLYPMTAPRKIARNESFCFVISNKEDMNELCLNHVQANTILGTNVFPLDGTYKQEYAGFEIKVGEEEKYSGGKNADDAFTRKKKNRRYTCHRFIEKDLFQVVAFFEPVKEQLCMVFVTPLPVLNTSKEARDKLEELINLQRNLLVRLRQQQAYNDYDPYDDPGLKNYLVPDAEGHVTRRDLDLSKFDQDGKLYNQLSREQEEHKQELAMFEREEARSESLAKKTVEYLVDYFKKFENDATKRWAFFSVRSMPGEKRKTKEEAIAAAFKKLKSHETYAIKHAKEKFDNLNLLNDFMRKYPEYPYKSAIALYDVYLQGIKRLRSSFTLYDENDEYSVPVYKGALDLNTLEQEKKLLDDIFYILKLFWRDEGRYYGTENKNLVHSDKAYYAADEIKTAIRTKEPGKK